MNKDIEENIKDIREDKKEDQTNNNNTNTKADTTKKQRSVETTFINLILQKFLNNMTKSAKNIFYRYTEVNKINNNIFFRMKNASHAERMMR